MTITIREASSRAAVSAFLDVPFAVYAGDRNWVPPLYFERHEHLSPKKNPYFDHADVSLFVAERDGKPVGRISAQIDRLHIERYKDATGQFGFLESPDDADIFRALTNTAEAWLKGRGMARVQGPFSFSINDETGLLIDGFNTPPSMMMGHARPHHARHLDALGYVKAKDVIAYDYDCRKALPRAMQAMVDKAKASGELTVRAFSKKHLARDLDIVISIFNDAWQENWGFVPMTSAEITALGNNLKMLVKDDFIAIAELNGEPAAMAITLPDINGWIHDLNGRLWPTGWAKVAYRLLAKPPAAVRMPLMGVKRRHHGTPMGAALALSVIDRTRAYHVSRGTMRAELSWILEDNLPMRRMIEALGGVAYKTYRVYEKAL